MASRNTIQKRLIYESLCRLDHPTADEIWQDVSGEVPSISKATVYRNLKQMVQDGKANFISLDQGPLRYDGITGMHGHFHCESCGKIYDLHDIKVDPENSSDLPRGATVSEVELVLHGICPNCASKESHCGDPRNREKPKHNS